MCKEQYLEDKYGVFQGDVRADKYKFIRKVYESVVIEQDYNLGWLFEMAENYVDDRHIHKAQDIMYDSYLVTRWYSKHIEVMYTKREKT